MQGETLLGCRKEMPDRNAHFQLAQLLSKHKRDFAGAEKSYRALLSLSMGGFLSSMGTAIDFGFVFFDLGKALHAQGRVAEALASFRRAWAIYPEITVCLCSVAAAQFGLHDCKAAIISLNNALAVDPKCAKAHYLLGHVHMAEGNHELGAAALKRALAINPQHEEARELLKYTSPYTIHSWQQILLR